MDQAWKTRDYSHFNLPQGPVIDYFADCANEGNYFLKFIDTKFRQNILYQTNLYVTQKHRRVPVATDNELYAFLKIDLLMGYHSLPAIKQYWLNDVDLKVSLVSDAMPWNRYQQILANLHVNDNNAMPENNTDKLYRIRPFVDALNNNFILLYNVNEHISVDESMILFKRSKFNEAIHPHEANKTWLQNFVRADMDGYMSKFSIYQGKKEKQKTSMHWTVLGLAKK